MRLRAPPSSRRAAAGARPRRGGSAARRRSRRTGGRSPRGGGEARGERLVEGVDLAGEEAVGPAVRSDVVHRDEEDVILRGELEEPRPQDGARGEIEGAAHLGRHLAPHRRLALALGQRRERGRGEGDVRALVDRGDGAIAVERVRGPQHLVPAHDLRQRPRERAGVERALQPGDQRHHVRGIGRVELVQEPEALLAEREGEGAAARDAGDGGAVFGGACGALEEDPEGVLAGAEPLAEIVRQDAARGAELEGVALDPELHAERGEVPDQIEVRHSSPTSKSGSPRADTVRRAGPNLTQRCGGAKAQEDERILLEATRPGG